MKIISLVLVICLFIPYLAFAQSDRDAEEATKKIFPALQKYDMENRIVDEQEFKIFTVFANDEIIGWAVILDEMGKVKPITFMVGIGKEGEVLEVRVLEYRELRGRQIERRSFLRQFKGKTVKSPLRIGHDIDAVTGATISSEAVAAAVKKSLKIVEYLSSAS